MSQSTSVSLSTHHRLPKPPDAQIIQEYLAGASATALALKHGRERHTIARILKRAGVALRSRKDVNAPIHAGQRRLSDDDLTTVIASYCGGESIPSIAGRYQCSEFLIRRWIERSGIELRIHRPRHALNDHAFDDVLGNSIGEYLVGLIMADGCVIDRACEHPRLAVTLTAADGAHLELLREFIGTTTPIRTYQSAATFANSKPTSILVVRSARLAAALARYGVVPRKSKTAKVLLLEDSPAFWCGMVCGDGFVTIGKQRGVYNRPRIGLTGSLDSVSQFRDFLNRHLGILPTVNPNHSIFTVDVNSLKTVNVCRLLFTSCPFALPRKKQMADEIIRRFG
jgi:hypothetical protein